MRIVSITIGLAVGAYIAWEVMSPVPALAYPCADTMDCAPPSVRPVSSNAVRPGLRIALFDPSTAPQRDYDNEPPHAAWISSAEGDPGHGPDAEFAHSRPVPVRPAGVRLTGLGLAGGHGLCLILEDGKRRCLAFIPSQDELSPTLP